MGSSNLRMTPAFFHLLLSLSSGPRHGYTLMKEIEERTDSRVSLGPSSLYYSLGRLEDAGLIEETEGPDVGDEPHEERRRYYTLTDKGRLRLEAESEILAGIVAHARATGVL
jgi:DNA-binding PadR family transcriptional regulator